MKKLLCLRDVMDFLHEQGYPMEVIVTKDVFLWIFDLLPPSLRYVEDFPPHIMLNGCCLIPDKWPKEEDRPASLDATGMVSLMR